MIGKYFHFGIQNRTESNREEKERIEKKRKRKNRIEKKRKEWVGMQ